jgi:hypothetical protein
MHVAKEIRNNVIEYDVVQMVCSENGGEMCVKIIYGSKTNHTINNNRK